jgi:hypothetical protein
LNCPSAQILLDEQQPALPAIGNALQEKAEHD